MGLFVFLGKATGPVKQKVKINHKGALVVTIKVKKTAPLPSYHFDMYFTGPGGNAPYSFDLAPGEKWNESVKNPSGYKVGINGTYYGPF